MTRHAATLPHRASWGQDNGHHDFNSVSAIHPSARMALWPSTAPSPLSWRKRRWFFNSSKESPHTPSLSARPYDTPLSRWDIPPRLSDPFIKEESWSFCHHDDPRPPGAPDDAVAEVRHREAAQSHDLVAITLAGAEISKRRPLVCKSEPDCLPRFMRSHSVFKCAGQRLVRVHGVQRVSGCVCLSWHTLGTTGVWS